MPVDFQQIHAKIVEIAPGEAERLTELQKRRSEAIQLLDTVSMEIESLRRTVEIASKTDSHIRCAKPANEPLNSNHPCPALEANATLIAVDGSQINPDRHASLQYAIVNVGAVIMKLRSGEVTDICTQTALLYGKELETESGIMGERLIALRRDIKEREMFDGLSKPITGPVVTFTDGPLELWSTEGEDAAEFQRFLQDYKGVLSRLQERGAVTAGYVDKPAANLVVRLLELAELARLPGDILGNQKALRASHKYRGVDDRLLFGGTKEIQPLIFPGHRSAVFQLQSSSQDVYTGVLALNFFYMNVGTIGHPCLVRVEIPQWVADDPAKVDLLHCVLVEQCEIMGHKPYPYLLHRAHETAVVRQDEKPQVERMLELELNRYGAPIGDNRSNKQSLKDLPTRRSRS